MTILWRMDARVFFLAAQYNGLFSEEPRVNVSSKQREGVKGGENDCSNLQEGSTRGNTSRRLLTNTGPGFGRCDQSATEIHVAATDHTMSPRSATTAMPRRFVPKTTPNPGQYESEVSTGSPGASGVGVYVSFSCTLIQGVLAFQSPLRKHSQ